MNVLRIPAVKMLALAGLVLILLIPLFQVRGLIAERRERAMEAESSIASQWGEAQTLATPWLLAHFPTTTRLSDGSFVADRQWRVLLADEAEVVTTLVPEMRYRGMFQVPVYTAKTTIHARFSRDDMAAFMAGADEQTAVALRIGMSDARGLRALDRWEVDGQPVRPAASSRELAELASIGHALPVAATQRDFTVDIALTIAG
ncbi:MAG TPA: inner membrane CreD family protein, partial [Xanthomonadales bacterium]|nr:inner membrane CreD family protein [Xanthomonadales bacterium]